MSERCIRCGKPSKSRCGQCKAVAYCGQECQVAHWKGGHKGQCKVLSQNEPKAFIDDRNVMQQTQIQKEQASKAAKRGAKLDEGSEYLSKREEVPTTDYLFPPKRVMQMMTYKNEMNVGIGLHNFGNSCYLNSVLQCFTYTVPLANYLQSGDHSSACKIRRASKFCMLCELEDHVKEMLIPDRTGTLPPRNIFLNLRQIGDFLHFQQEDAHDFAYAILNSIQKGLLSVVDGKVDAKREETSLLYQIFGGYMQSQIKCMICANISSSFESFLDLALEVSSGDSVEEALEAYTNIEHMDESIGWKCEKCKKAVPAQKQLTIYNSPNILTVTLKRFDLMNGGGKVNKPVAFRENLSLKRVMSKTSQDSKVDYDLYAIIVHYGPSVFSGHYTAFVKVNNIWWLFDDDKVTPVKESLVLKQNAYMLFYERNLGLGEPATKAQRKGLKVSSDEVSISNASPATSSVQKPKYKIYSREQGEDQTLLQDLVVKIEVPLLFSTDGISLQIQSDGEIYFDVKNTYNLELKMPLGIDVGKAFAEFYKVDGLVLLVLPVSNSSTQSKISLPVKLQENSEKLRMIEKELGEELVMNIAEIKKSSNPKPQKKNVEEATYSKLYREISKEAPKLDELQTAAKNPVAQPSKVGRNEDCPCGSGKKYKKCHGK